MQKKWEAGWWVLGIPWVLIVWFVLDEPSLLSRVSSVGFVLWAIGHMLGLRAWAENSTSIGTETEDDAPVGVTVTAPALIPQPLPGAVAGAGASPEPIPAPRPVRDDLAAPSMAFEPVTATPTWGGELLDVGVGRRRRFASRPAGRPAKPVTQRPS